MDARDVVLVALLLVLGRISEEGNAIGSVRPSVRPFVFTLTLETPDIWP